MPRSPAVYILTNRGNGVLYTGVTNDLARRFVEHASRLAPKSFAARYRANKLVYYEVHGSIVAAIEREKTIKGWLRRRKRALVDAFNPDWRDLSDDLWK